MAKDDKTMTSQTKKTRMTKGQKTQWQRHSKIDETATSSGDSVWDRYSFADAMDAAGEPLVYEPNATQIPRTLVYRLRLDEREMASLQRLARERSVSISVILREFVNGLADERTRFELHPGASACIRDPNTHEPYGSFAHIVIANNGAFAPRVRCWFTFLRADGSSLFPSEMPGRWSSAPEPISTNAVTTRPDAIQLIHYFDPSKMSLGYVQDFAKGEENHIAVAIKFADGSAWGWTQESYQHNWRHPSWRLPNEQLRVRARIVSDGQAFASEFILDCRSQLEGFGVTNQDEGRPSSPLPDVPYIRLVKP
ncbi:MAG TPA: hypothetical protein VKB92_09305 [Myxococcales bacterium]|nr:hypothetical protein [Myxococcales bacterium]